MPIEEIQQNQRSWSKSIAIVSLIYLLGNTPEAIRTFNLPEERIKRSLTEQLRYEQKGLFDISGGMVYAGFRMGGICAGYTARKAFK